MSRPDPALAAVLTVDGTIVGAGFLVAHRQVLTCAHVVAAAVGQPADLVQPPEGSVLVEFPLVAAGRPVHASVVDWVPIDRDGAGDVAVLRLAQDPPAAAAPARLAVG